MCFSVHFFLIIFVCICLLIIIINSVSDFQFHPFYSDLLITAGLKDGCIKLWKIPEDGLTDDVSTPLTKFDMKNTMNSMNDEQSGKMNAMSFHPVADNILACACSSDILEIIDINTTYTQKNNNNRIVIDEKPKSICCLQWSNNGQMLGSTSQDRYMRIFDPRNHTKSVMVTHMHVFLYNDMQTCAAFLFLCC